MKLTGYTHNAVRMLMYLAAESGRLRSISEIARTIGISRNHLMKVAHDLRKAGFVIAVRGRSGGIRLARPPSEITIGEIVRHTERGFEDVDRMFGALAPASSLQGVYDEALRAFSAALDAHRLADLVEARGELHAPD